MGQRERRLGLGRYLGCGAWRRHIYKRRRHVGQVTRVIGWRYQHKPVLGHTTALASRQEARRVLNTIAFLFLAYLRLEIVALSLLRIYQRALSRSSGSSASSDGAVAVAVCVVCFVEADILVAREHGPTKHSIAMMK